MTLSDKSTRPDTLKLFADYRPAASREKISLALPEKALLDTIYRRKAIPFRDELELPLLDRQRLVRMAKDFPGPTRKLVQGLEGLGSGLGA